MIAAEAAVDEPMTLAESNEAASMDVHRAGLLLDVLDNYIYEGEGHASEGVVEMLRTVRGILTQASDRLDDVEMSLCKQAEEHAAVVASKEAQLKALAEIAATSPRGRRVRRQKKAPRQAVSK